VWQVFVDFKKAYDSIHRESLYNIMYEFGIPSKLISLTKVCMNGTKYQVRVDNVLSKEFQVVTGLKQPWRKLYGVYKGITMVSTSAQTRLVF
jgi:sorting nexin-29